MGVSILLAVCVAINTYFVWVLLSSAFADTLHEVSNSLKRTRRFLTCRMTDKRERAIQKLTVLLFVRMCSLVACILMVFILFAPSMLFAYYTSDIYSSFFSVEALIGMLVGLSAIILKKRKKA